MASPRPPKNPGRKPGEKWEYTDCPKCGGTGRKRGSDCLMCNGTGKIWTLK